MIDYAQETGFFLRFKAINQYSRKNPVSDTTPKKPGYAQETGFFTTSAGHNASSQKKPGF
ncbi:MAG: hypothetical protein EAZ09_07405 [Oscillatoriales cyanobacterium]|nr:MAG: hypothetical protein EAZ09_07405 [Oscillatoriales cyanobacterium]